MNLGEVVFRNQFRLGRQPIPHFVPLLRTLVHLIEVRPGGYFVR